MLPVTSGAAKLVPSTAVQDLSAPGATRSLPGAARSVAAAKPTSGPSRWASERDGRAWAGAVALVVSASIALQPMPGVWPSKLLPDAGTAGLGLREELVVLVGRRDADRLREDRAE